MHDALRTAMNWQRLITLIKFDLYHSVFKLKGLVFLIPYLLFWYCIFSLLFEHGTDFLIRQETFIITAYLFNTETAQSLLIINPPTLSVYLILALVTMPFFVMLAGNDQLASDSGKKTFRYLLTRCTRLEIYLARFISAYLLMAITIIIVGLVASAISIQHDNHTLPETLRYTAQVILVILAYALPFFAFMAAISAWMSSALGTLLMGVVVYIFLIIFDHYLALDFSLLPSGLKNDLSIIDTKDMVFLIIDLMAYTLIYASFGWLIFRKRNL